MSYSKLSRNISAKDMTFCVARIILFSTALVLLTTGQVSIVVMVMFTLIVEKFIDFCRILMNPDKKVTM